MIVLSEHIASHITFLQKGEEPLEVKPGQMLQQEYRRKLVRYQHTNRILQKKYQMDFNSFQEQNLVAQNNYAFEVENDAVDWEMAVDGIKTMTRKLNELTDVLPVSDGRQNAPESNRGISRKC